MGIPTKVCLLCLKVKVRSKFTWLRDFKVDRFGRINTSLKSNLMSFSMRGMMKYVENRNN